MDLTCEGWDMPIKDRMIQPCIGRLQANFDTGSVDILVKRIPELSSVTKR